MSVEERAVKASSEYLRSLGWEPALSWFSVIEGTNESHKFRLVLEFLGKKPNPLWGLFVDGEEARELEQEQAVYKGRKKKKSNKFKQEE